MKGNSAYILILKLTLLLSFYLNGNETKVADTKILCLPMECMVLNSLDVFMQCYLIWANVTFK